MTQTQQDQGQQQQNQQRDDGEQSLYDQSFLAQVSQGHATPQTVDWAREYFDSIEAQVRSARRVVEVAALGQIKAQIAAQAAMIARQYVRQDLQNDPTLRQTLMASTSTEGRR